MKRALLEKIILGTFSILVIALIILSVLQYNAIQDLKTTQSQQFSQLNNELDEQEMAQQAMQAIIDAQLATINTTLAVQEQDISMIYENIAAEQVARDEAIGNLQEDLKQVSISSNDFSAIVDEVLSKVVFIYTGKSIGSGAVINSDGYVITNCHVVCSVGSAEIIFKDGKRYPATMIGYDDIYDIAVLKIIADRSFTKIRFADSDEVRVGQKVIAVGAPNGLSFSVTEGIVSATSRRGPVNQKLTYIQTDVPLNPGNSGGPLVDINGEIVGINNYKLRNTEGLGFALESNTAQEVANEIIEAYESTS